MFEWLFGRKRKRKRDVGNGGTAMAPLVMDSGSYATPFRDGSYHRSERYDSPSDTDTSSIDSGGWGDGGGGTDAGGCDCGGGGGDGGGE
jgi:hypothetical protein